jgi:spore coat protein U-like protein
MTLHAIASSGTHLASEFNQSSGRKRLRCLALVCFFAAAMASCAVAQTQGPKCSFSVTNISFGTVDLQKGNPYDAAGTFTYACTGDSREIIRICPSWGLGENDTRWMTDAGGNKLFYNLYTDPDRTTVWGTWYSKNVKGASIDVPLGRSERTTGSVPVYGRITANQQSVPPGTYKAAINRGNAAIAYAYSSQGSCDSIKHGDRVSVGPSIMAVVPGAGSTGPGAITAPDATHANPNATPQATGAAPDQPQQRRSTFQKLMDNAKYQQEQQNKAASASAGSSSSDSSQNKAEDRAKYLETHSCMTTMGADKANELADDCVKVTSAPHSSCSIQENTCEEIQKATQKGCWGLAASAPDFCLTKYR